MGYFLCTDIRSILCYCMIQYYFWHSHDKSLFAIHQNNCCFHRSTASTDQRARLWLRRRPSSRRRSCATNTCRPPRPAPPQLRSMHRSPTLTGIKQRTACEFYFVTVRDQYSLSQFLNWVIELRNFHFQMLHYVEGISTYRYCLISFSNIHIRNWPSVDELE